MTIKEIKEALLGKHIYYYNGWNGSCDYFTIGHIVKDGTCARVFHKKGNGFGIFIPIKYIKHLLETGEHKESGELERCHFEKMWKLTDSTEQNL